MKAGGLLAWESGDLGLRITHWLLLSKSLPFSRPRLPSPSQKREEIDSKDLVGSFCFNRQTPSRSSRSFSSLPSPIFFKHCLLAFAPSRPPSPSASLRQWAFRSQTRGFYSIRLCPQQLAVLAHEVFITTLRSPSIDKETEVLRGTPSLLKRARLVSGGRV